VNSGHATWYQVATEAAELLGVPARLKPITTEDARFVARASALLRAVESQARRCRFRMPTWQDALRRWLAVRRPLVPSGVDRPSGRVGRPYRMTRPMGKRAIITAITGQDGSYLAELLLEKGYEVTGVVRRSSTPSLWRIEHLLDRITLRPADLVDQLSIMRIVQDVRPHEFYNLAAMSFVPASWISRC
jgi:dTDP-4-dehydrorhamnose reductase